MTMRTKKAIICDCGHTGFIICAENDSPYSTGWEKHSLQGFSGHERYDEPYFKGDLLEALEPRCLECGQKGKVRIENSKSS